MKIFGRATHRNIDSKNLEIRKLLIQKETKKSIQEYPIGLKTKLAAVRHSSLNNETKPLRQSDWVDSFDSNNVGDDGRCNADALRRRLSRLSRRVSENTKQSLDDPTLLYTVFNMKRGNLSLEIRNTIRNEIVNGQLEPFSRINEVHFAARLEISRTPLREALFGLVNEQLVVEIPRRGFFVAPLSVAEIEQLYVIRRILDPAALKLAGIPNATMLKELNSLNKAIARASQVKQIIDLDDRWHLLLIQGCQNDILLRLIKDHMLRTRRYEFAYFSQSDHHSVATDEHFAILEALEQRKLSLACKRLEQNMTSAESPLIEWVRSQENTQSSSHE